MVMFHSFLLTFTGIFYDWLMMIGDFAKQKKWRFPLHGATPNHPVVMDDCDLRSFWVIPDRKIYPLVMSTICYIENGPVRNS